MDIYILEILFTVFAIVCFATTSTELLLNYLYSKVGNTHTEIPDEAEPNFPTVTAIVPSRNEPVNVIKMTIDSVFKLNYPKDKLNIVLVDNSDESNEFYEELLEYSQALTEQNDRPFNFIHRNGTDGFKAKNIDIALEQSTSDVVLFLDVDSTLSENCLIQSIPILMKEESNAFVQMETMPTNMEDDNLITRVQGISSLLQRRIQGGCMNSFYSMFYGHNAVWKRKVLEDVGSWVEEHKGKEVLTEDMSMSLRASKLGYKGKSATVFSGEWVPTTLKEVEKMWYRWAYGTFQVFHKHLKNPFKLGNIKLKEALGWYYHVFSYVSSGLIPLCVLLCIITKSNILFSVIIYSTVVSTLMTIINARKVEFHNAVSYRSRLTLCYQSTFLLGSYISWIKFKALIGYAINKRSGWTPTAKSSSSSASSTFSTHYDVIAFALISVLLVAITNTSILDPRIVVALIYPIHLLATVVLFRSRSESSSDKLNINSVSSTQSGRVLDFSF